MDSFNLQDTVILADGSFPQHEIPLHILNNAERIICCDGAAGPLTDYGLEPFAIVGDCDSLNDYLLDRYNDRIFKDDTQETNDLTKTVRWCSERGYDNIVIIGATGKREDHTLGNISLLAEYTQYINVKMITDTGIFYPVTKSAKFKSSPGQQISVFSINPDTEITSTGLLYPLKKRQLRNWWQATLNEATGDHFELEFDGGPLIVYIAF